MGAIESLWLQDQEGWTLYWWNLHVIVLYKKNKDASVGISLKITFNFNDGCIHFLEIWNNHYDSTIWLWSFKAKFIMPSEFLLLGQISCSNIIQSQHTVTRPSQKSSHFCFFSSMLYWYTNNCSVACRTHQQDCKKVCECDNGLLQDLCYTEFMWES